MADQRQRQRQRQRQHMAPLWEFRPSHLPNPVLRPFAAPLPPAVVSSRGSHLQRRMDLTIRPSITAPKLRRRREASLPACGMSSHRLIAQKPRVVAGFPAPAPAPALRAERISETDLFDLGAINVLEFHEIPSGLPPIQHDSTLATVTRGSPGFAHTRTHTRTERKGEYICSRAPAATLIVNSAMPFCQPLRRKKGPFVTTPRYPPLSWFARRQASKPMWRHPDFRLARRVLGCVRGRDRAFRSGGCGLSTTPTPRILNAAGSLGIPLRNDIVASILPSVRASSTLRSNTLVLSAVRIDNAYSSIDVIVIIIVVVVVVFGVAVVAVPAAENNLLTLRMCNLLANESTAPQKTGTG
ncbi:hypothetical protein CSOJ01_09082 [Colletotrichum sojae]|uniref:Uncharacterized protein n=1 Tax=Colletotrichum sojae TaxID=2175907 RepID=A0A8H6MRZ1_9PEZI|nr:hypothetical protein CSOJ01_09082 [Colletotrichum sojae]